MIIGNFTYNKAKDTYTGEIKTLTLHRSKVVFRPAEGKNAKGPDYRVLARGQARRGRTRRRLEAHQRSRTGIPVRQPRRPGAFASAQRRLDARRRRHGRDPDLVASGKASG